MNEYPYFNPYAPYMPMQNSAYPPSNQIQGVRFVSNRQEAESCAVPRGTKALLMDSNKDIFYLKETDVNGISTISEYSFKKVEPQTADNYITKDEFNKWKEQYESIISNIAANTNAATEAGPIETQMYRNGNALPAAHAIDTGAAASNLVSQAFSALVTVPCNAPQATINVKALSATSVRIANIIVVKIA